MTLDLGLGGYAFVVSKSGKLVSHPNKECITLGWTIDELARRSDSDMLDEVAAHVARAGTQLELEGNDPMTELPAWTYCGALAQPGWQMCTVTVAAAAITEHVPLARRRVHIACVLALLLMVLGGLAPGVQEHAERSLWRYNLLVSVALIGVVIYLWTLAASGSLTEGRIEAVIAESQIARTVAVNAEQVRASRVHAELHEVPTGLLVERMQLAEGSVSISGIVWQRFELDPDEDLPPWAGVALSGAYESTFARAFDHRSGATRTVGWRFQARLDQDLDASRFPFEQGEVHIDLQPREFDGTIVLVPDLAAYDAIIPSAQPGVGVHVGLSGWRIQASQFSFLDRKQHTDFGLGSASVAADLSRLRFTVEMRRELINPMVVYVLPVSILFFLIFAVLLMTSLDDTLMSRFGFNASASIGAYGTFFFIAVLEHVSLRDAVQSSTLVYFEWFYIVLYVLLMLLSLNALLFATNHPIPLVDQRDNLWPKVLYWPVSTGLMCAVTLYTFY